MSIPDSAMPQYMKLVTRWTPELIANYESGMQTDRCHPRDVKMALAREIVEIYWGATTVAAAEEHFKTVFQKGALPADMEQIAVRGEPLLVDFLAEHGLVESKSKARRLIQQSGIRVDGRTVNDINTRLGFSDSAVVQVGKRKFVRVTR